MHIASIQPLTLTDFPGVISCIVFTAGCNMRCGYCYNVTLTKPKSCPKVGVPELLDFLRSRQDFLDGVVITGGEPTFHKDLPDLLRQLKQRGWKIKLDTNGTNPAMLRRILDEHLVDYVAMDIKSSFSRYKKLLRVDGSKVLESAKIIMQHAPDYEFRTTVIDPYYALEDAHVVAQDLKGAKRYFLQQFQPLTTLDPAFECKPQTPQEDLQKIQHVLKAILKDVQVRA